MFGDSEGIRARGFLLSTSATAPKEFMQQRGRRKAANVNGMRLLTAIPIVGASALLTSLPVALSQNKPPKLPKGESGIQRCDQMTREKVRTVTQSQSKKVGFGSKNRQRNVSRS